MTHRSKIDLSQFQDSPYADELGQRSARLHFSRGVESGFRQQHLERARFRVRIWGFLTVFCTALFTLAQVSKIGSLHPVAVLHYALLPPGLLLAWLPWSRYYLSHYLPIASVITPITCALTAPFSAQAVTEGRYEVLILVALQVVGIFQFTGLLYRMALIACIALLGGFAVGAAVWGLPLDQTIKYTVSLCIGTLLGAVAFRGIEVLARTEFLEGKLLGELVEKDPLTGLNNRRSFDAHLQRTWLQALRDGRRIAVLMADVDHFKSYNDLHGHQSGDAALRQVAATMRECGHRPLDMAARYGGEEFSLILHDVTVEHAQYIAERIRAAVEALAIAHRGADAHGIVTLSVGVALVEPTLDRTANGAVQLADEALYEAKASGRNRIVLKDVEAHRTLNTGVFKQPSIARMTGSR